MCHEAKHAQHPHRQHTNWSRNACIGKRSKNIPKPPISQMGTRASCKEIPTQTPTTHTVEGTNSATLCIWECSQRWGVAQCAVWPALLPLHTPPHKQQQEGWSWPPPPAHIATHGSSSLATSYCVRASTAVGQRVHPAACEHPNGECYLINSITSMWFSTSWKYKPCRWKNISGSIYIYIYVYIYSIRLGCAGSLAQLPGQGHIRATKDSNKNIMWSVFSCLYPSPQKG